MDGLSELLKVQVDFNQSHLLFPHLVQWLLLVLLVLIAIVYGPRRLARARAAAAASAPAARPARKPVDRLRLGGCLALTVVYFAAMEPLGRLWPNTGMGFLLASMPYGVALSWLFVHDINRHKAVLIAVSSVLTPLAVWAIFAYVFKITLP